jgi:hypothetical protein
MQNYHVDNPAVMSEGRHMINPTKDDDMSDMISKADAWDALAQIPPKTQRELDVLRPVSEAARHAATFCGRYAPKEAVAVLVPLTYLNEIRASFGMDPYK